MSRLYACGNCGNAYVSNTNPTNCDACGMATKFDKVRLSELE